MRLTYCYCLQSSFCLLRKFVCDKFYVLYSLYNHSTRNNIKSLLMCVQNKLRFKLRPHNVIGLLISFSLKRNERALYLVLAHLCCPLLDNMK
ncbi:hypothetical protein LDENG_00250920 [Lucifuga dentata]|nr:hypothetical protein LDENG_00250920 [Lucifuga dentata]